MGLKDVEHYKYNGQSNIIRFNNESTILLKDLDDKPSDVNKDSLGGLELTAVFVDEATQISETTYQVLRSRIRFKLNEYGLIPKILLTCNPAQNWVKKMFYIPYKEGTLPDTIAFVPSLPTDNPHLPDSYLEVLRSLPEQQRKRLLLGDWDYVDDPLAIFDFDSIASATFKFAPNIEDGKYITVDVARFGSDRSVIVIWVGLVIIDIKVYRGYSTTQLADVIKELMKLHGVHNQNVILDSDGVGGGVADIIRGTNFVNNAKPLHGQNFTNLKSQCYVKLSELFKKGSISINLIDPIISDDLTNELLVVKLRDIDKDNKIGVLSKDEMKRILGRSPDISDAVMMRMFFELHNKPTGNYSMAFVRRR